MNRYSNNFKSEHSMEKKASSKYDALMINNRPVEEKLKVSSFSITDNEQLNSHIQKEAREIEGTEFSKQASEGINKQAFFEGGLDLFATTKQLIVNKLGVSDAIAHDMTSPILSKAEMIRNQHGGDDHQIIEGVLNEMGTQMATRPNLLGGDVGVVIQKPVGTKQWMEQIKERLTSEIRMSSYDSDRAVRMIMKESQDLVTMLRPHSKYDISDAIIEMMKDQNDPTIIFGLKDSDMLVNLLRGYLQ